MTQFGFVIDNRKCIGCHACTVACKSEHEVPIGVDRTWVKYVEKGTFPTNRRLFTVMRCNHCEDAPCVTICPVTALYRRADGVVDFNSERCIGCKACMQACPYDALFIDPNSNTAAKCNFCTHRLDAGLEPSCVVVCPTQAIVAGDLADPQSEISQLVARHPVQVRKPEKGTRPKLFYIDADEASLVPSRTEAGGRTMWSRGSFVTGADRPGADRVVQPHTQVGQSDGNSPGFPLPIVGQTPSPRRVYDVRPRAPAWGWQVPAYTWTKSIAAGSLLALGAARLMGEAAADVSLAMGLVALLFLLATTALLVADLKQPLRFLYVLLRPQWGSWLVRGAYFLVAYGTVLSLWLAARLTGAVWLADLLIWPGVVLAAACAVYTAFLFAQAKGRDFWQNPLLCVHLLAHALLAGGAVWLLVTSVGPGEGSAAAKMLTLWMLAFSLMTLLAEILTVPPTEDARRALDMIIGREMGLVFWGLGVGLGHLIPLALLLSGGNVAVAGVLILAGMLAIEWLWVLAPQRIPLS